MINDVDNKEIDRVKISEKVLLTINETIQLFNLGEKKLRSIAKQDLLYGNADFTITNGNRILFKREAFTKFINN